PPARASASIISSISAIDSALRAAGRFIVSRTTPASSRVSSTRASLSIVSATLIAVSAVVPVGTLARYVRQDQWLIRERTASLDCCSNMQLHRQSPFPHYRPRTYGARAARLRSAAEGDRYLEIRDVLLRLAATYEELAARGIEVPPPDDETRIIF